MAAEQLLQLLTLYGFTEAEEVAPALREACEDKEANTIIQWLAENIKPEDISGCSKDGRPVTLSRGEEEVAAEFTESLLQAPLPPTSLSSEQQASREKTARILAGAAEDLKQETAEAKELEQKEQERAERRIADLRHEIEGQISRVADLLASLEGVVGGVLSQLGQGTQPGGLLSMQNLADFRGTDAQLMASLQHHYAAHVADKAGEIHPSKMQGTQHLVADSEANVAARAQALERMRLSYTCSLEKSVRMAALKAKTEATLQALQGGFTRPELSSQDVALLKAEGDKQQGFLDKLLARKKQILDVELPALCKSVGSMHCWEAVKADYDAELHRNKHYIGEKEKVMRVLEARAARIAALVAAAKQEGGALLAICNSLRAVAEELEAMWAIMQLRVEKTDAAKTVDRAQEPYVGSPIKAVPAADMVAKRQAFSGTLFGILDGVVPDMQKQSGQLHALAFKSADVADPELTPEELSAATDKLQDVHKSLLNANEAVYKQQEAYNNIMRLQRDEVHLERSVFPLFYTQPEKLAANFRVVQGLPAISPSKTARKSAVKSPGKATVKRAAR